MKSFAMPMSKRPIRGPDSFGLRRSERLPPVVDLAEQLGLLGCLLRRNPLRFLVRRHDERREERSLALFEELADRTVAPQMPKDQGIRSLQRGNLPNLAAYSASSVRARAVGVPVVSHWYSAARWVHDPSSPRRWASRRARRLRRA